MLAKRLAASMVAVTMGGCARQSAPVTIAQALHAVQQQLAAAGAVSAVGSDPQRFADAARAAQCASGQADPEVPLLAHELTIDLTGSFTASGGFSVGPQPEGFGLSLSGTRTQGQELSLPLSFVALSEIPSVATAQRLSVLAALPDADRRTETVPILADRDALRARIAGLIADWNPAACRGKASSGLFHPNVRPAT
jgi:hypothetical protein